MEEGQPLCTNCKKYIKIPYQFRLYDPCNYDTEKARHFYRYESCTYCQHDYKIEYFTTFDRESGAAQVNYVEQRLEGFSSEQFQIDCIIPESSNDAEIIRIVQKDTYFVEASYFQYLQSVYRSVHNEVYKDSEMKGQDKLSDINGDLCHSGDYYEVNFKYDNDFNGETKKIESKWETIKNAVNIDEIENSEDILLIDELIEIENEYIGIKISNDNFVKNEEFKTIDEKNCVEELTRTIWDEKNEINNKDMENEICNNFGTFPTGILKGKKNKENINFDNLSKDKTDYKVTHENFQESDNKNQQTFVKQIAKRNLDIKCNNENNYTSVCDDFKNMFEINDSNKIKNVYEAHISTFEEFQNKDNCEENKKISKTDDKIEDIKINDNMKLRENVDNLEVPQVTNVSKEGFHKKETIKKNEICIENNSENGNTYEKDTTDIQTKVDFYNNIFEKKICPDDKSIYFICNVCEQDFQSNEDLKTHENEMKLVLVDTEHNSEFEKYKHNMDTFDNNEQNDSDFYDDVIEKEIISLLKRNGFNPYFENLNNEDEVIEYDDSLITTDITDIFSLTDISETCKLNQSPSISTELYEASKHVKIDENSFQKEIHKNSNSSERDSCFDISIWQFQSLILFFTCEKCDRQFETETSLADHIKTIHKIHPYSCKKCDYKIQLKDYHEKHTIKKKREKESQSRWKEWNKVQIGCRQMKVETKQKLKIWHFQKNKFCQRYINFLKYVKFRTYFKFVRNVKFLRKKKFGRKVKFKRRRIESCVKLMCIQPYSSRTILSSRKELKLQFKSCANLL